MKRSTVWPALVMIGGLVLPQPALAQYYPPSALRPTAGAVVQRNMRGDAGRSQVGESGPGVAHDALVGAADEALYRAKRSGKNRVETAAAASPVTAEPRRARQRR